MSKYLKMLESKPGSHNGRDVNNYPKDEVYAIGEGFMPESLAESFLSMNVAILVGVPKKTEQDKEEKMETDSPENKDAGKQKEENKKALVNTLKEKEKKGLVERVKEKVAPRKRN